MTERASGWYEDPNDPATLRYWDGILWTDRTMPRIKPGLDDSHIATPPQMLEPHERHHPAFQQHQGQTHFGKPATATTPDGQALSGWWRRALAMMIDNVLTFLIALPISWHWLSPWVDGYSTWFRDAMDAARAGQSTPEVPASLYQFPWQVGIVAAVVYLVYEVSLTVWRGQTVGKMLLGIKVRRAEDERPPSLPTALYRFGVKQISTILAPAPFLGFVAAIFQIVDYLRPLGDRHRQAFHDSWPGTYVVRTTKKQAAPPMQQAPPPPYQR